MQDCEWYTSCSRAGMRFGFPSIVFLILGLAALATPPAGNAFETAPELPIEAIHTASSTRSARPQYPSYTIPQFAEATVEPDAPLIDGVSGSHSVWFKWRSTLDSHVLFSGALAPGTNGPLLAVYSGDQLQSLQLVSTEVPLSRLDSTLNPRFRAVGFQAKAGLVYHLRLDAQGALPASAWAAISLYLPASNDAFASRALIPLSGVETSFYYRLIAGTAEPKEPLTRGGDVPGTSVWFEFMLPESGAYQVTAAGDADLAVFQGDSLASLVRRSWTVEAPGSVRGSIIHDERFQGVKGERLILAVNNRYALAGASRGTIRRVPLYDPVAPPKIQLGSQQVGPPKLTTPAIRPALLVEGRPNRIYEIQTSSDLRDWHHWQWHVPADIHSAVDLENGAPPEPFLRVIAPE